MKGKRGFLSEAPIQFSVGNQSGMSLQDAMDEKYEGLVGRDDGMFLGCDCTAISLRLEVSSLESLVGAKFVDAYFLPPPHSGPSIKLGLVTYVHRPSDLENPM
jgi:hypothetical protein